MIEISRRGFLQTMLALGMAPAVVRASSIMRVRPLVPVSASYWDALGDRLRAHGAENLAALRDRIVLEDAAGNVLSELLLTPEAASDFGPGRVMTVPGLYPYPSAWAPSVGTILKTGAYAKAKLYHHGGKLLEVSNLELRMNTNDVHAGDMVSVYGLRFHLDSDP